MEEIFNNGITPKKYTGFIMPSIVMTVVLGLYYAIDTLLVAAYTGDQALATLSLTYPVSGMMWGISVMLAAGSSAIVAMKMGMGRDREANEKFTLICIVSVVLSLLLIILAMIFMDQIIVFLGATRSLEDLCGRYLRIAVWGCPGAFLGVIFEYYIRVDGRPGFTLFLYLVSGGAHIAAAWILMGVFGWGIEAAAVGSVVGLSLTAIIGLIYFIVFDTKLKFVRPQLDWNYILHTVTNGSSEFVTEASDGIATYFFNILMMRLAGPDGVAALSVAFSIHYFVLSIHIGYITGLAPLISYYYGAQKFDKVDTFLRYSRNYMIASAAIITAVFFFGAPYIVQLFESPGSSVYEMSVTGMRLLAPSFLFSGLTIFGSGFFTAYGNGVISALISLSRGLIALIAFVYLLTAFWGTAGLWLSTFAAEAVTAAMTALLIYKYRDRYKYSFTKTRSR